MDFRSKELICWIIPGIYFQGMLLLFCMMTGILSDTAHQNQSGDYASAATAVLLFIVPVFGFIIGYIINFLGSYMEYALYTKKFTIQMDRPSRILLNNAYSRSPLIHLNELKEKLGCGNQDITNEMANKYLHEAKQSIEDTEKIDYLHTKSIFSRNLFTSHVILLIIMLLSIIIFGLINRWVQIEILCNIDNVTYVIAATAFMTLILPIYWNAWRRNCIIYVRSCFLRYLETSKDSDT